MRRFLGILFFFFSSRRRHTRFDCDWSSGVLFRSVGGSRRGEWSLGRKPSSPDRPTVSVRQRTDMCTIRPEDERQRPSPTRHERIAVTASNPDRKSTRLNSSHSQISYAVFCLKKKK